MAIPSAPTITRIDAGDAELAIDVSASDESLKVFAIYKKTNKSAAWSEESATLSRTGSGSITITGLTNGVEYDVLTYHKDATETSIGRPSNIYSGYPDSDPNGTYRHALKIDNRDQIAWDLLQICKNDGDLMTFRNDGSGTEGITVYGIVAEASERNVGIQSGSVDAQRIIVNVPRQTNFPPDNFNLNSTIEVDEEEYQLQTYSMNPNTKTYAAEFILDCLSIRGQENI